MIQTSCTTIRCLAPWEIDLCIPCGHAFYREMGLIGAFVPAVFVQTWQTLFRTIPSDILSLWHDETLIGAFGVTLLPDLMDGRLTATEMFWYIDPAHRKGTGALRLLRAFEDWADEHHAVECRLTHLLTAGEQTGDPTEVALARVYRRLGYAPTEVSWHKALPLTVRVQQIDAALTADDYLMTCQRAEESTYQTVAYGGHQFPGMAMTPIGPLELVARTHGVTGVPVLSYFRDGTVHDVHETYIHYDQGLGSMAMILYLSDNVTEGTAFWTHRATGTMDVSACTPSVRDQLERDQHDESKWELREFIPMVANRAILFPTTWLHSRYPSSTSMTHRRIQVGFFT